MFLYVASSVLETVRGSRRVLCSLARSPACSLLLPLRFYLDRGARVQGSASNGWSRPIVDSFAWFASTNNYC